MWEYCRRTLPCDGAAYVIIVAAVGAGYVLWRQCVPSLGVTQATARVSPLRIASGPAELIGRTPLVLLKNLSQATGSSILAKAEHLNPGGSVHDREALAMLLQLEADGKLTPHGGGVLVVEPACASAAVGLAVLSQARGYKCLVRDSRLSEEVTGILKAVGASLLPAGAIIPTGAVQLCSKQERANFEAHFQGTGPEILQQVAQGEVGHVDAFVCGADEWGALHGCGAALQQKGRPCGVYSVQCGAEESVEPSARHIHQPHTPAPVLLEAELQATSAEVAHMGRYLLRNEGFFVGQSAARNLCGAVKAARTLGPGHTVVTLLSETGEWCISTFHQHAMSSSIGASLHATDLDFIAS